MCVLLLAYLGAKGSNSKKKLRWVDFSILDICWYVVGRESYLIIVTTRLAILADCSFNKTLFESEVRSPIWQQSGIKHQETTVKTTHNICQTTDQHLSKNENLIHTSQFYKVDLQTQQ